jgi:hypothetical protein
MAKRFIEVWLCSASSGSTDGRCLGSRTRNDQLLDPQLNEHERFDSYDSLYTSYCALLPKTRHIVQPTFEPYMYPLTYRIRKRALNHRVNFECRRLVHRRQTSEYSSRPRRHAGLLQTLARDLIGHQRHSRYKHWLPQSFVVKLISSTAAPAVSLISRISSSPACPAFSLSFQISNFFPSSALLPGRVW